jgi:hypothetical protein
MDKYGSIAKDAEHLQWIHSRLQYVYDEDPRIDYMVALQRIIDKMGSEGELT